MNADGSRLAHRLGYAGLLPFVMGCGLIWLVDPREEDPYRFVRFATAAYAALTVSLLGGIHWGLCFARGVPGRQPLVWGAAAMSLAWLGVVMPPHAGLALLGAVLIACYVMDRRVYPQLGAAGWLTLRFRLTAVAALSCFLAAAGS
jgi:hypothetical protein